MDIKNDIHIMKMNDKLYQRLIQSEHIIHAKVESVLGQISSWKYATHELYVPAPYQNELAGLPSGRIRKNVEEKDRLKIAGLYSFGFDAEGKILCSQEAPENIENGIITDIYEYDDVFSYHVFHVRYIPNQYTIIISISYFYSYHEMSIFQGINAYKDWSVYLYEYDKGRISKVHRYASCWGDREAEEYNFVYDNNILCAIVGEKRLKNGELDIHWKNKKVYNKES